MKPGAVMLMGLPGAGKGTQAFRLARELPDSVHFDTGGEIYRRVSDPASTNDPIIQREKKRYFDQLLNTKEWVASMVSERIRYYSGEGKGVIFSGSPRTVIEAQTVLPLLEECYGNDRLLVVEIEVSPETARTRSLQRITCTNKACRYPATPEQRGTPCPNCGQILPLEMQKDERWKVEGIETRFDEFRNLTRPAIEFLKDRVAYVRVNGEKDAEDVFQQVLAAVREKL
jgi:adenylate kinase